MSVLPSFPMHIREFDPRDAPALRDVFCSSVHLLACAHYSSEQLDAWAPKAFDATEWTARLQALKPFVVERDQHLVAYADLQADGHIDHFFVSGHHPRQGIGRLLMKHIIDRARQSRVERLFAHVSLTAQPFFHRFGFQLIAQRLPVVRGVALSNALMQRVEPAPPGRAL
jgi:putative acetyltransferase